MVESPSPPAASSQRRTAVPSSDPRRPLAGAPVLTRPRLGRSTGLTVDPVTDNEPPAALGDSAHRFVLGRGRRRADPSVQGGLEAGEGGDAGRGGGTPG